MLVINGVVGFVIFLQLEVEEQQKHAYCIVAIKYHIYMGKKARLDVHREVLRREVGYLLM